MVSFFTICGERPQESRRAPIVPKRCDATHKLASSVSAELCSFILYANMVKEVKESRGPLLTLSWTLLGYASTDCHFPFEEQWSDVNDRQFPIIEIMLVKNLARNLQAQPRVLRLQ